MNIQKFIKLLIEKLKYILILPIVIGGLVFLLTMNLPLRYFEETTIFTGITSNSGIQVEEIRVDNNATANDYNNVLSILKSTSFFEEISLSLLTQHLMLDKPQKDIISEHSFEELQEHVPDEVKKLIVKGNFKRSYKNLSNYIKQDESNYIYNILNFNNPYYSVKSISRLKGERVNGSDLVKISYESQDPGICYNTLKFASAIFINRYGVLKSSQSGTAVAYYERKLKEISAKLNAAEDKLLAFNVENNIINYYEQTEQVTTQQEKIEIRLQEVKMESEAANAVLEKLEEEVDKRYNINLRSKDILNIRERLITSNIAIARNEVNENTADLSKQRKLKLERSRLEDMLKKRVDSAYVFESKSQGIESQKMLGEWLDAVKNQQSYTALYKSMVERQLEFMKQYQKYAPLGATIKRIEREIDVDEREYLNVQYQLGLALQKQQNTDMVTNMKVMDEAKMPISAIPSKGKLYVLISAIFSVLFYVLGVFIVEVLDRTIKTPSNLEALCGHKVIGAFCLHNNKFTNTDFITDNGAKYIYEQIRFDASVIYKPYVIQMFSHWENAGKKFSANIISEQLKKSGYSTQIINFSEALCSSNREENIEENKFILAKFLKANNYSEFAEVVNSDVDYIISIIPPISNGFDNTLLLKSANMNFLVYDSTATWMDADKFILDKYNSLIDKNTYSILTKANPDRLEEMYGEIPKKHSSLRDLVKKT